MSNYVVCLKWGTKYSAEYVNKLYNMVTRNLTVPHEFVCFTDDTTGINLGIRTEPLTLIKGVKGWWYKPMFFNPDFILQGTILFLDLDLIIFRNIDSLFTYKPGKFCIIRDFNRCRMPRYPKFNSSVFRLNAGHQAHVYTEFMKDPARNCKLHLGDQEWIYSKVKDEFEYWPEELIRSYKWEMRNREKIEPKRTDGVARDFVQQGTPSILKGTSVAVFHGDPNPHSCKDEWVAAHWK